jgi:hypothetical protein
MSRSLRRSTTRALGVAALVVGVVAAALPASAEPGFSSPVALPPPVHSASPPLAPYGSISCPATSDCVAVGAWGFAKGAGRPTVLTEQAGVWGAPQLVAVPAGGTYGGNPPASLSDVSCPDVGDCVAVGSYAATSGAREGMLVSESSGTWGSAGTVALPANAAGGAQTRDVLGAVDCVLAGSCVAVGVYLGTDHLDHAMAIAETAGTWGTPVELPDIAGLSGLTIRVPSSVACADVTDCTVVGYGVSGGVALRSSAWTETSGVWSRPTSIAGPRGAPFYAASIACPSATTCVAVGGMGPIFFEHPAAAVETSGTWGAATDLRLPTLSPVTNQGALASVSCAAGACEAVGVLAGASAAGAAAATWSAGTWSAVGFVRGVHAGAAPAINPELLSVSCPSSGPCGAVGFGVGQKPAAGGAAATYPFATAITPVRAIVAPGAPVRPGATGLRGGLLLRWSPPFDDGGSPVRSFTATVVGTGRSCHTAAERCAIRGLRNGHRYRVEVRAVTAGGTSAPAVSRDLFVAGAVPSAPSGVVAVAGVGFLDVSWTASRTPPGEPVLRYVASARAPHRALLACRTRAHRCRLGGLSRGTTYVVSIVAVDASGVSRAATRRATTRP